MRLNSGTIEMCEESMEVRSQFIAVFLGEKPRRNTSNQMISQCSNLSERFSSALSCPSVLAHPNGHESRAHTHTHAHAANTFPASAHQSCVSLCVRMAFMPPFFFPALPPLLIFPSAGLHLYNSPLHAVICDPLLPDVKERNPVKAALC